MTRAKLCLALFLSASILAAPPMAVAAPTRSLHHAASPKPAPWVFVKTDVAPDPGFRTGQLANGMRYILRHNETPKGEVLVRLAIAAGSLDEGENERGYAHFVEHMVFQGSTHVPQGEMIKLLERQGLAFGAHTNAFTGAETTTYHLDLPRNTPTLIDTALMLMRETVSELTIDPATVKRESGVILAEKRDRDSWQYREIVDRAAFADPQARYTNRMPIGTEESLKGATADGLRAFWRRNYVPSKAVLIVVGDVDVAQIEASIRARFADWPAAPAAPQPDAGPIDLANKGRSSIYLDPALSEHLAITRRSAWSKIPDSWANRREALLRAIGYGIINRRLQSIARSSNPPFRAAQFGTGNLYRAARETALHIDSIDGQWRRAMLAAVTAWRGAMEQGVTPAEVEEQLANLRAGAEAMTARAATQSNGALVDQALALVRFDAIPGVPADYLAFLRRTEPEITPDAVMAAVKRYAASLDDPLIRFTGRRAPDSGEAALRSAWNEAMAAPLTAAATKQAASFAYTDFGPAGSVISDRREPAFGIRQIRFANGVMLNLKHTDLAKDSILFSLKLDGGHLLATKDNPLAVEMTSMLASSGLGKHTTDELQTLNAGKAVSYGLGAGADAFGSVTTTRPADLLRQLQLQAALLTDPGYRPEAEAIFRQNVNTLFLRLRATPSSALQAEIGGILSDNDPRYSLQPVTAYRALTFAKLKRDIGDRLAHGALELALVGDVDEETAIRSVAQTFGALPLRETEFQPYPDAHQRSFTANRAPRQITHKGPADQALVEVVWPTRDDSDPQEKQVLNLLQRIIRLQLTENLRQKLGRAYSPSASSEPSRIWKDYGTFSIAASVDTGSVEIARQTIAQTVAELAQAVPSQDLMLRARQPLLETIDNALKTNGGWLSLTARAQSEPDQIERHLHARERLLALTADQVRDAATRYLVKGGIEFIVTPEIAAKTAAQQTPQPAQSSSKEVVLRQVP
ncbi:insulinase family protein [Novosphingobium umbonatum]|uniref:Insulinase family protein n=1 Tax=Novosphingobium umbonatum TaxID=1908524 RepID=A0A3S2UVW2_9SPHN|nr:insulinase family protein [Novosphingobium umbonatum]RVU06437.1 insulinase family protein [Novosphingobium umbonatum]